MVDFERIESLIDQLAYQEDMFRSILNAMPWGVLVVDEDYYVVAISDRMEEICGYTNEELKDCHLHVIIPEKDRRTHKKHEKEYKKNPRIRLGDHPLEPQIKHKDGHLVEVEISLAPVDTVKGRLFIASIRERDTLPRNP